MMWSAEISEISQLLLGKFYPISWDFQSENIESKVCLDCLFGPNYMKSEDKKKCSNPNFLHFFPNFFYIRIPSPLHFLFDKQFVELYALCAKGTKYNSTKLWFHSFRYDEVRYLGEGRMRGYCMHFMRLWFRIEIMCKRPKMPFLWQSQ